MDSAQMAQAIQAMMMSGGGLADPPKKKRKRGGLAGLWDRNKSVIKPVVSGAAGLVGGPAAAALAGGLMGGLDRKGKGGVGFSVGGGLRGAAEGALAGGVATAGKAGLAAGKDWFGAAKGALQGYGKQMGIGGAERTGTILNPLTGMPMPVGTAPLPVNRAVTGALRFAKANPVAVGAGLNTAGQMLAANQQMAMQRDQTMWDRELFNRREADRRRLAELLAPLFLGRVAQQTGRY